MPTIYTDSRSPFERNVDATAQIRAGLRERDGVLELEVGEALLLLGQRHRARHLLGDCAVLLQQSRVNAQLALLGIVGVCDPRTVQHR